MLEVDCRALNIFDLHFFPKINFVNFQHSLQGQSICAEQPFVPFENIKPFYDPVVSFYRDRVLH